ncbi:MAG: class I mannose-6-phosphate isomerase [Phycisphaeraceae bacterium]|nr:class I mannose-6-phosphate isomerase [Phycisphaeraceae bacterium]
MTSNSTAVYPLKFKPIYKEKVWGGRTLTRIGRSLPGDQTAKIGESWELADLSSTSQSGGGGGQERSVIANGPLAGQTLHQAMAALGQRLLGNLKTTPTGNFPLLVKYLDAREHLSVQVHPSPAYAASHPEAHLKSEAWYIVEADPGAAIYKGIQPGVTPQQFRQALAANTVEAVEPLMIKVPVKPGDCHYLPSGTCHALGAGLLVAEVQTPSDTTFRVFDWGRQGRELHVEQAMANIDFGPAQTGKYEKRSHIAGHFTTVSRLVTCDFFRIEKIRMSESYEQEIPYHEPAVWMVLQGKGQITQTGGAPAVDFARGETLLVPAGMQDARVKLLEDTVWLEATFPQALPAQIA